MTKKENLLEKLRFVLVGCINTAVDFTVLNLLINLVHAPIILANVISTSCAMVVSLLLNKQLVFKDNEPFSVRKISLFIIVSLSGLWIIQSAIIFLLTQQFPQPLNTLAHELAHNSAASSGAIDFLRNNIAKVFATVASLIWNYYFYKNVVFRRHDKA